MKAKLLLVGLLVFGLSASAMAADNLKEMFSQGSIKGEFSLLSFTRDYKGGATDSQDTALGGALYYKTDSFKGISLGVAFGTSNDVVNQDDKNPYVGLTTPGHENIARMQEYYIQGDYFDTTVKVGAHELNTPFLNIHPIRMIHRTYRGLSVVNKSVDNLSLMGFYLKDNMNWFNEEFVSFNDDVYIAGAKYKCPVDGVNSNVQAWYFNMPDNLYQAWFNASFSKKFDNLVFHTAPTYFMQKSQGDEESGELDTYQYGLNAGVGALGFDLTAFYAKTGDQSIYDPYGYGKIIIQQVHNSGDGGPTSTLYDRGDEDAYALRLSYDFAAAGMKGLSAYVMHALYDAPAATINETDFSIQYKFSGAYDGLSIRARYAKVDVSDAATDDRHDDLDDIRFYVTYRFGMSGK